MIKKFLLFLFCSLIVVLIIVMIIVPSSRDSHFSTHKMAICDGVITNFDIEVNSKKEALSIFKEWLVDNTDYTNENNNIVSIEEYRDYYEIRLEIAANINGRFDGVMGYKYYVITKNGDLQGYYMSK